MQHIFIDTNIFLSFYKLEDSDIAQLEKLPNHLQQDCKLYLTTQVENEFYRNRESVILKSEKKIREMAVIKPQFPTHWRHFQESQEYTDRLNEANKVLKNLIIKVDKEIVKKTLRVDLLIEEIFNKANKIDSSVYYADAKKNFDLGVVPGKTTDKIGDAINWECLIDKVPKEETLHFISGDKDFRSIIDNQVLSPYFKGLWTMKRPDSDIKLYTTLTQFFSVYMAEIQLKEMEECIHLISDLQNSPNYASTHKIIEKLQKFDEFSEENKSELLNALAMNNQVLDIFFDNDVSDFYLKALKNHTLEEILRDAYKFKNYRDDEIEEEIERYKQNQLL